MGDTTRRPRTVSICTLGCKSNQYDSSALEDSLRESALDVVAFPGPADAYIINTCTVTGKTDHQSRQLIRKIRRENPSSVVIVTGCYAQVSSDEVARIEGVDYILGNPEKSRVVEFINRGRSPSPVTLVGHGTEGTPLSLRARSSSGRTRANLKVQEGCNRLCSYCIIPKARGRSKSLALDEVEREIDSLVESGYREVILTGIHLGAWGADFDPPLSLVSILALIEKKDYPCRFRISSLDPDEVTDGLIDIMKTARRVCNHLHLPLQSGDDSVIRNMKRPYTREVFREKVERVYASVPEVSVGADVIAGFPGEGETEFENTFSLLKDLPVSYLHIFPYSKRRGTAAAEFKGQVAPKVVKERCERLKRLDSSKRELFYGRFLGKTSEVLIETAREKKTGLLKGRTRNYIQVRAGGGDEFANTLVKVRLTGSGPEGMRGDIIGEHKGLL
jgi:threonylcarbamoyladenosine tRNA methylthiotransferase MtaB